MTLLSAINTTTTDEFWMRYALSLAETAASCGEVPVGALIVQNSRIISTGFNLREKLKLPSAHAEFLAIEDAARFLQSWRLSDCELYVTLEPCLMCAGLIYQARLKRVIFGALDPKGGALGSLYSVHQDQRLNHRYAADGGCLAAEAGLMLSQFFGQRRAQQLARKSRLASPLKGS